MAFIRQKVSRGRAAFYVVESVRVDGKPRQKVLAYLGPCDTIEGAIAHWESELAAYRQAAAKQAARAADALAKVHPAWIERNGGVVPDGRQRGIKYRNNVCAQYWWARRRAERYAYLAEQTEKRLALLRSLL